MDSKTRHRKEISRSLLMDETGSNKIIKAVLIFILMVCVIFLIWAAYVPLTEVVSAKGEVQGMDNSVLIQHSIGGKVQKIYVMDQQIVFHGDPILKLDDSVKKLKIEKNKNKLNSLNSQLMILQEEMKIADQLYQDQLVPAADYLSQKRKILDLKNQIVQTEYDLQQEMLNLKELTLRSPVDGIIHGLHIRGQNMVISAGMNICHVIPSDAHFRAEIQIPVSQIGSVKEGLPVILKFSAYNYSQYGGMETRLGSFSASTYKDKLGNTYYKGSIVLPENYLGGDKSRPILQGMTLSAEIISGEKTLFEYLFLPVKSSLKSSFNEP